VHRSRNEPADPAAQEAERGDGAVALHRKGATRNGVLQGELREAVHPGAAGGQFLRPLPAEGDLPG